MIGVKNGASWDNKKAIMTRNMEAHYQLFYSPDVRHPHNVGDQLYKSSAEETLLGTI